VSFSVLLSSAIGFSFPLVCRVLTQAAHAFSYFFYALVVCFKPL
jgi:hypothetical protein